MGLGIDLEARYSGSEEDCRRTLVSFLEKEECPVPGSSVSVLEYGQVVRADVFFAEENIFFTFTDDGTLAIAAKTNDAGPGYHAFTVRLLEKLLASCGLEWDNEEVADETGYWHNRDFEELQAAMGRWLGELSGVLVKQFMAKDVSGMAICMGTERVPDDESHYAAHLLGWLDRDFFIAIDRAGPTQAECENFFIWWDEKPDAHFYRKCALSRMWCECNWLPPVLDSEKRLFTSILLCLENAWDDDPGLVFPVREWKELARLSDSVELAAELERRFPRPVGESSRIGYMRGPMRHHLGSGWRITLPGQMHEETDSPEGSALVYWNERMTIHVSRYTVTGDNVNAENLLSTMTESIEGAEDFPVSNQDEVLARISHELQTDKDGNLFRGAHLFAAVDPGSVAYISAFYEDSDECRDDVELLFSSLSWQESW